MKALLIAVALLIVFACVPQRAFADSSIVEVIGWVYEFDKNGNYVTSESQSILPSITNKSLMTVAADLGLKVERRKVRVEELADFTEVAACGTAVVITPVGRIFDGDKVYDYHLTEIGPVLRKLYDRMTGIQYGEIEDTHNWTFECC